MPVARKYALIGHAIRGDVQSEFRLSAGRECTISIRFPTPRSVDFVDAHCRANAGLATADTHEVALITGLENR
jgi:hypothetical protein